MRRNRATAKIPARQATSQSSRTTWKNAKKTQPAPGITSAAISASTRQRQQPRPAAAG